MKTTGIGRSEQIDWTVEIPQPGRDSTSAVIRSGQLAAADATASTAEAATSNAVHPHVRRPSSTATAIRESSSMRSACIATLHERGACHISPAPKPKKWLVIKYQ